MVVGGLQRQCS